MEYQFIFNQGEYKLETQILQIIEKYHEKVQNQPKDKIENHIYDYELAKAILDAPESYPRDMLERIKESVDKKSIDFRVINQLKKLRLDRPNKRVKWVNLVKQAGKNLSQFAQDGRDDYAALYGEVKRVVFVQRRTPLIESKAIVIAFLEYLDDNTIYKEQLNQVIRIANFGQSKDILRNLIDLIAYERGLEKKKSVRDRLAGKIAGMQDTIRLLTSQSEDTKDKKDRIDQENEDLRAALEIAEQQLESFQDEIDQIREEAKQEVVVSFFQEMNSVKFSNLLDQFSNAEEMLKRLKRENYEIPQEIEVIPALIRMFMRFLKIYDVQPKAMIGLQRHMNLKESEEYEYVGSDFEGVDEQKAVEIKSTGWEYAGTLISKPKAEEVQNE